MFPEWRKVTQKLCIEVMYWKCDIFLLCSFPINWGHSVISVTFRSICYFSDTVVSVHTAVNAATWILHFWNIWTFLTSKRFSSFLLNGVPSSLLTSWLTPMTLPWAFLIGMHKMLFVLKPDSSSTCKQWIAYFTHPFRELETENVQPWNNVGLLCGKCHRVIKRY